MTVWGLSVHGRLLIQGQQCSHSKFISWEQRVHSLVKSRDGVPEHKERGWAACWVLTLQGQCFSTSDTPGIAVLLQLVGSVASEARTSHTRAEVGVVHSSNPTSGTAGVFLTVCKHTSLLTVQTQADASLIIRSPPTHCPLHGAYTGNLKHKVNSGRHFRHLQVLILRPQSSCSWPSVSSFLCGIRRVWAGEGVSSRLEQCWVVWLVLRAQVL